MKKFSLLLIIGLLAVLAGCSTGGNGALTYPPAEVEFLEKNIALSIGESIALEYQVSPSNAVTSNVRLESSDTSIVKINGVVAMGVSEGTAAITAYYQSDILGQCVIKVSHVEPERIWLSEEQIEVKAGRKVAIAINSYPEKITDTEYTFQIADESIAEYINGYVKGIGIGTTSITCIHNTTGLTADCVITVIPIEAESIRIAGRDSVEIDGNLSLSVAFHPEDVTDQTITWEVSDESIATIEESVLYAHKVGRVTVTAYTSTGVSDQMEIEVLPILPTGISLECDKGDMLIIGDKVSLTATISPKNTTDKTIEWKSSDKSIASVNSKGTVKALKPGKVTITATLSNGVSDSYSFTINPKPVKISNGFIKKPSNRKAPVTIHAPKDASCYVYFKNSSNSKKDFSLFVKAGSTVKVKAPLGHYTLYYATGETWYGVKYRFGVGTSYYLAESTFDFYEDDYYVYGTTVTLYQVYGGNMSTHEIDESQFPG